MAIMFDGHSTTIAFAADSNVQFEVKELTPPSVVGGGPINVTTMENSAWRTMFPKSLKEMGPGSLVVAYDPAFYAEAVAMVNVNQLITVTFPDASTLAFYGWIDEFTPNNNQEGEQPSANITIQPSQLDGANAETGPVTP